jgi:hypothetical protein
MLLQIVATFLTQFCKGYFLLQLLHSYANKSVVVYAILMELADFTNISSYCCALNTKKVVNLTMVVLLGMYHDC